LAGNCISFVENLDNLPSLEILHLDSQKIEYPLEFDDKCMEALRETLTTLTVSGCRLTRADSLSGLTHLKTLDISNNLIEEISVF
jgi:Leucine-rich repeat (LRR) protein